MRRLNHTDLNNIKARHLTNFFSLKTLKNRNSQSFEFKFFAHPSIPFIAPNQWESNTGLNRNPGKRNFSTKPSKNIPLPFIYSIKDPYIKKIKELRTNNGRLVSSEFLVEGVEQIQQAITAGYPINDIFISERVGDKYKGFISKHHLKHHFHIINHGLIYKLYPGKQQDIFAIAKSMTADIEKFHQYKNILLLENLQDPGNVGTIIRSAEALNVQGILTIFNKELDIFHPSVIRASMGSVFRMPIADITIENVKQLRRKLKIPIIAATPHANVSIFDFDLSSRSIIAFGNETHGLSLELLNISDSKILIPMANQSESINVTVATGIFLFEKSRQTINCKPS